MKKGVKFSLCTLGISIGLATLGLVSVSILKHFDLKFRAWVGMTFFVIMVLLGLAVMGGIIYTLVKVYSLPQEQKSKKIIQKFLSASGIMVALLSTAVLGIVILFSGIFAFRPEHVIEKHDQKMVAYVYSFLDVNVSYHEYKNFLVCGYDVIGKEWYGSGGYDPFKHDSVPEPKTYEFYDSQGNLIAQSGEEIETE